MQHFYAVYFIRTGIKCDIFKITNTNYLFMFFIITSLQQSLTVDSSLFMYHSSNWSVKLHSGLQHYIVSYINYRRWLKCIGDIEWDRQWLRIWKELLI